MMARIVKHHLLLPLGFADILFLLKVSLAELGQADDGEGESAFGEIDLKPSLDFLNTLAG